MEWNSDQIPLKGNENLTFVFNPINQDLRLSTEAIDASEEVILQGRLSSQTQKVVLTSDSLSGQNPRRTPRFNFWATKENQLTRAPDLVFARIQNENGKQLLLQDFNLIPQTRSNLHELKMATIPKDLRRLILGDGPASLELIMVESVDPGTAPWRKVRFDKDDGRELSNGQNKKIIGEVQEVKISGDGNTQPLITWQNDSSKAATDPQILASRRMDGGKVIYTISVEAENPQDWVVQVLDEHDRIPRMSGLKSFERVFQLGKRGDSDETKVTRIDHVFEFKTTPSSERPLFFGFARLADLIDGERDEVNRVTYDPYFK